MAGNRSDKGNGNKKEGAGIMQPMISVVIPVHNGAATLPQALDSALAQNVNLEIVVIDDGSTDEIDRVIRRYAEDPRVRFLKNEKNIGAAASRNRGVKEARGNYVAFLDSDDYWADGKLKKQMKVMEETDCVLCSTGRELMTPNGRLTGRVIGVKEVLTYRDLLRHNSINCSSVLMKREIALEFPMEYEDSHEDYITWLKILKKYEQAVGINEPLLKYRLSSSGKSGSKWKSAKMTFRVYRYMGFNWFVSVRYFVSYALNGAWKYFRA